MNVKIAAIILIGFFFFNCSSNKPFKRYGYKKNVLNKNGLCNDTLMFKYEFIAEPIIYGGQKNNEQFLKTSENKFLLFANLYSNDSLEFKITGIEILRDDKSITSLDYPGRYFNSERTVYCNFEKCAKEIESLFVVDSIVGNNKYLSKKGIPIRNGNNIKSKIHIKIRKESCDTSLVIENEMVPDKIDMKFKREKEISG